MILPLWPTDILQWFGTMYVWDRYDCAVFVLLLLLTEFSLGFQAAAKCFQRKSPDGLLGVTHTCFRENASVPHKAMLRNERRTLKRGAFSPPPGSESALRGPGTLFAPFSV